MALEPAPECRQPRIAIVTQGLERGGTETHLLRILPDLRSKGINVHLYVLDRGGVLESEFERAGIAIDGPPRRGSAHATALTCAWHLTRYLRTLRPDAVHYFLPRPYLIGSLISLVAGRPLRLMSRRSLSDYQRKYPLSGWLERRLHRGTAALLGNSQAVIRQLADETRASDKIGLIPNGVPLPLQSSPEAAGQLRASLGLPGSGLVMIIVANLIPYKGHADLLNGLFYERDRLPDGWRLLVVGRDDGILNDLRRQADALGIGGHVLWLGERRDVPLLLQIADLALLSSHQEGSPNSLIEAMMNGVPVVATAVGGVLDLIDQDKADVGLLVPPHAPAPLGAAIRRLANDPALRAEMGRRGAARAQADFSLPACVQRYANLYTRLAEVKQGRSVQPLLELPARR